MMHTHDFLDQAIIENGAFTPFYEYSSVRTAILEIIKLMNITIQKRPLSINLDTFKLNRIPDLKFDKRRLQQVLINLLSNAIKHQTQGEIKVEAMIIRDGP